MSTKKLQIVGSLIEIDSTLTQAGQAADAKVTGDAINSLQANIDQVSDLVGATPVADQITEAIANKAEVNHNHDDKYYTEPEIDDKLASKSDVGHSHDNLYYTTAQIDNMELITVEDIDDICGTTIIVAPTDSSEVKF